MTTTRYFPPPSGEDPPSIDVTAVSDTAAIIDAIERLYVTEKLDDINLRSDESIPLVVIPKGKEVINLKPLFGFAVLIPVVKNGPAYQDPVRLRYRVVGGRVLWKFSLYRTDLIFEEMIREAVAKVEKETALPVYRGKPEA